MKCLEIIPAFLQRSGYGSLRELSKMVY